MSHPDLSHQPARTVWQSIGEISLPVNPEGSQAIHSSLQEKLGLLQLPTDIISKITKSIHEIMERSVMKDTGPKHIHLFLHVPAGYNTHGGSWGFFRIERVDAEGTQASGSHAVDLYLYPE